MHKSLRVKQYSGQKLSRLALSEIGSSLTDIDWRLLHWLLHYPLQRADDLVIGVARWASRATVYRHVRLLEVRGLVESVLPKTPGMGKWLYHLSNSGLHLLAWHLNIPARELARRWHADDAALLRMVPRLPTMLLLQDVVNGLVVHAAEAMTTQGRRPQLIRWSWQRDLTHHFQYREKRVRFFADGVMAVCVRTQQREGQVLDQWYGAFLLSTELNDERLMRLRLERLMYWRESPERWSCYQHMLPALIVVRSPRQREHWQRAVAITALKVRLDPLAGALACMSSEKSAGIDPWLCNWRTLATDVSCHLQEILGPLPDTAFPSSLHIKESDEENDEAQSTSHGASSTICLGASARLSRLIVGDLPRRAAQITQDALDELEIVSLLGMRLTAGQWNILRLLLERPLLSDEELAALLGLERKSVRCALYRLHQLACLEQVGTLVGKRWHLCERGLRLIAASDHMHIRNIAEVSDEKIDKEASPIRQRGDAWFLQHIQHTAGIYGFFADLSQETRKEAGHELCWWETGAMCERRYRVGEHWYNLRPDALAEYRVGQQQFRFWLEWDRGTMNVRDLTIKFASYAHFIVSREWARECSLLPVLVCIAPDIAQEKRIQRVAHARLKDTLGFVVYTTTEVLLNEHGPRAPIWASGSLGRVQRAASGVVVRQHFSELIFLLKAP